MAAKVLNLSILTPEGTELNELPAEEVIVPAENGMLGIRPGHAPLMALLKAGMVTYISGGKKSSFEIYRGLAEVLDDNVIILAGNAEIMQELAEETRLQASRKEKNAGLVNGDDLNIDEAAMNIERSIAVLNNLRKNAKQHGRKKS